MVSWTLWRPLALLCSNQPACSYQPVALAKINTHRLFIALFSQVIRGRREDALISFPDHWIIVVLWLSSLSFIKPVVVLVSRKWRRCRKGESVGEQTARHINLEGKPKNKAAYLSEIPVKRGSCQGVGLSHLKKYHYYFQANHQHWATVLLPTFHLKYIKANLTKQQQSLARSYQPALLWSYTYAPKTRRNWLCHHSN